MKAILILLDSVNRKYLKAYGNEWVHTPNIDRLQERSVTFDNHWVGSAPCMPARRDMLTGRLNFLERNWGPIEPFDYTVTEALRSNNIYSHIITDHFHYLKPGGENYCQSFDTWEFFRGQEVDPWVTRLSEIKMHEGYGQIKQQYEYNRTRFISEQEYPTPLTLKSAADWLEDNRDADDYMLWVEAFDPHEPFDVPEEYLKLYNDEYTGPQYEWPHYQPVDVPEDALEHIKKRYAALLTMTDKWLGKLLDKMDQYNLWEDTMVIFTSDHGFMLGEHGFMAKNYMPAYNEVFHIPLMVHLPGGEYAGNRLKALTQNIDIFPTLLEYYGIEKSICKNPIHGKSLLPLIRGEREKIRNYAIYGYFAKNVNITDGKYTYFRTASNSDNTPIYVYGAMPTTIGQYYGPDSLKDLSRIEMGRYLKWTDYPLYKIPGDIINQKDKSQAFDINSPLISSNHLFDIERDYLQQEEIKDEKLEKKYIKALVQTMKEHDSPDEQFERLGLLQGAVN